MKKTLNLTEDLRQKIADSSEERHGVDPEWIALQALEIGLSHLAPVSDFDVFARPETKAPTPLAAVEVSG